MSVFEATKPYGLRALTEHLRQVGDEVLGLFEQRSEVSGSSRRSLLHLLQSVLTERLAAAAERIVWMLEREVEEYRAQLERQGRILDSVLSPVVRLNRMDSLSMGTLRISCLSNNQLTLSGGDSIQLPTAPASPESSDVFAVHSKDNCRGNNNPSSKKDRNRSGTDGGRGSGGQRQQTASLDQPAAHCCMICRKRFQRKLNLLKHVETHSENPQCLCGVCGEHFDSSDRLGDHFRSHRERGGRTSETCGERFQNVELHMRSHVGIKAFSCEVCGKSFPRPGALTTHKKIHSRSADICPVAAQTFTHNPNAQTEDDVDQRDKNEQLDSSKGSEPKLPWSSSLSCKVCGDSFHSQGFLRKHAESHCRESRAVCGVCGQQLPSADGLLAHLHAHRDTSGTCSVCEKTFQNMETHMRSHTGIKPYQCGVCSKRFPRPGALRRHNKLHSGERPCTCRRCGSSFMDRSALRTHSRSHEEEDPQTLTGSDNLKTKKSVQENNQASHSCKVCGEYFPSKCGLRKHAKAHLESICGICGKVLLPSETMASHLQTHRDVGQTCHVCGKSYQNMETHMRSHTGIKPYHCGVCSKSFPRPGALRRHNRIHSGERPYICEFCGKTFIDYGALRSHIRNHTGDKPAHRVPCETCGKSLASVHVLEVHRRIHTGEKPFECHVCGKAFRQAGGLSAHTLTHTGEKPFTCSVCHKSFSTKGYLETHIRFHNKERAFSCHLCWKAFVTKNDLKKHLLTHTGEKPYSCRVCGKSYQEKRSRDIHMKLHLDVPICKKPIGREDDLQPDFIQL